MLSILLVDDEQQWLDSFKRVLTHYKITAPDHVLTAQTGEEAIKILSEATINIVYLDLIMHQEDGKEVLKQIKTEHPEVTVAIMTGINDVYSAVKCMQEGASDYLIKTASVEEHIASVKRLSRLYSLEEENKALKESMLSDFDPCFESFITNDPKMFAIFRYLTAVASSKEPLLITGESGVGKGVLAKIFAQMAKPDRPFVSINIAGIDEHIFSDTLFGHIKGAYTGAESKRVGLIQQAHDGILFMDEIGELPLNLQVKLLYLLQEGSYQQLGSDTILSANVRFVLATNQDLKEKQQSSTFRKDLYYRISTHSVAIPPLRERKDDIPLLFEHFLRKISEENNIKMPAYDSNLIYFLMNCSFPGNVRQLRSAIYNAVLKVGSSLTIDDFAELDENADHEHFKDKALPTVDEMVNELIYEAMKRASNNQRKAASLIGLSQATLSRKLRGI